MDDRALPWDDTEWEIEARSHIERLKKAHPDMSKWIPSARWLAMALNELDQERSAHHDMVGRLGADALVEALKADS